MAEVPVQDAGGECDDGGEHRQQQRRGSAGGLGDLMKYARPASRNRFVGPTGCVWVMTLARIDSIEASASRLDGMRYVFSTGLFGAISTGVSLIRGTRETPITWRAALAWLSWGISLALAIGAAVDMRRDERGVEVAADSPFAKVQSKRSKKESKQLEKRLKAAQKR